MNAIPKVRKPRDFKGRRLKYNESPLPLKVKHGDTAWKSRHLILDPFPLYRRMTLNLPSCIPF